MSSATEPVPRGPGPAVRQLRTVALLGRALPPATAVAAALRALPAAAPRPWLVTGADTLPAGTPVDLVVCDAELTPAAIRRWPGAGIVAVAPARDDGSTVVRALDTGADGCVRGGEAGLVAAYVQLVARRRGLLGEGVQS